MLKDVLLTCFDNFKGILEALKTAFTNVHIQNVLFIK